MDAVRRALGVNRFMYYGASYSGVDVQAYAARFPSRLSAVVLDSPTKIVDFDSFFTPGAAAMARAVDLVCARSASCSADHRRASDDLAWLADRLRRHPVDGTGIDALGNAHTLHVTEGFLANRITYNDGGAFVSDAELAAAATSLRQGDAVRCCGLRRMPTGRSSATTGTQPVLRRRERGSRLHRRTFAWDKSAPISVRRRQYERARDQLAREHVRALLGRRVALEPARRPAARPVHHLADSRARARNRPCRRARGSRTSRPSCSAGT